MSILKVLGNLDESDLSFVSNASAAEVLSKLDFNPNKINLRKTFPGTHKDLITILKSMLEVNPYFRKRPEELLGLEIFD